MEAVLMLHFTLRARAAYTLLELIFVIVILGIVSAIGSEIIAQVYESYLTQRASYKSGIKTELAANQLVNRLTYAIPGTVIARRSLANTAYVSINELTNTNFEVLEWIGYDADSFTAIANGANRRPGWSGVADLYAPAAAPTLLVTPGSNLGLADTIIQNLSRNAAGIAAAGLANAAVFFPGEYSEYNIGYDNAGGRAGLNRVTGGGAQLLAVESLVGKRAKEHYKLAWSAYAIVPVPNANGTSDLRLYYNFQPWGAPGPQYQNAPFVTFLRNVSVFRFTGEANTIRFKICQQENIGDAYMITTCKEKAVIR
jgi:prepilin-type N-terminal cleavage/methylation domain-containing protein